MSNELAKLVVLSAPSGSGKSTLVTLLLERNPSLFKLSISHTTRKPRGQEKEGIHYFFVTEEKFKKMISNGEFLEYAHVYQKDWYGTSKKFVDDTLSHGSNVLFDIDVQGASNLKKAFHKRCVTIFIHPPSFEELERRLRHRKTDTAKAIEARLKTARQEIKKAPSFDYQVVNKDLEKTYEEMISILKKEHCC